MPKLRRLALAVAVLSLFAPVGTASAANFVVNVTTDPDATTGQCGTGGSCSLRQAVNSANANGAIADTITFTVASVNVGLEANGIMNFGGPLTIDGGGGVTINRTGGVRLLWFTATGASSASTVKNVTLHGATGGDGGSGVLVTGSGAASPTNTVTLERVTIESSTQTGGDGAGAQVASQGATLNVVESAIAGNSVAAGQRGGGLAAVGGAKLNVTRSLITNNTAPNGGGVSIDSGAAATVVNSTFSGNTNTTGGTGAAVYDATDTVSISYSTFTGNTAGATSAAFETTGAAGSKLKGNIFTGNSPANCKKAAGTITTSGFNFDSGSTCVTGANPNDRPNTSIALGSLADNGGPTRTHALPAGSAATDAGGLGGCTTIAATPLAEDQRGTPRPQGSGCDSGAFELVVPPSNAVVGPGGGDAGGGTGGGDTGGGTDTTEPVVTGYGLSAAVFRAASSGPTMVAARRPIGTRVSYTLSEAANVTFTVQRKARGRRRGGRCRAGGSGKRCTRWVTVGRFSRAGATGLNQFRFTGRLRKRKLQPRRYRLILRANDAAGNESPKQTRRFRVVR